MNPRNKTSAAWTALPEDFKAQVIQILGEHFAAQSKLGKFTLDGRIYKHEIVMRVGYLKNQSIRPVQFDLSVDYDSKAGKPMQFFENLVDFGAGLLDTYFKNPEEEFPLDWHLVDFEGSQIYVKQDSTNQELEAIADQLLGETEDDSDELIHGDLDNSDIEKIAESLNTPGDKNKH